MCGRDFHIRTNDMMEPQMGVNVGGGHLACRDSSDYRRGSCDCVAARENIWRIRDKRVGIGFDFAPDDGRDLRKRACVNRLTDGNNHDITGDSEQRFFCVARFGTSVRAVFADDLGSVQRAVAFPLSSASI